MNIKSFPIINFEFGNGNLKYNITFDYNDLFMEFNAKYYFLENFFLKNIKLFLIKIKKYLDFILKNNIILLLLQL